MRYSLGMVSVCEVLSGYGECLWGTLWVWRVFVGYSLCMESVCEVLSGYAECLWGTL